MKKYLAVFAALGMIVQGCAKDAPEEKIKLEETVSHRSDDQLAPVPSASSSIGTKKKKIAPKPSGRIRKLRPKAKRSAKGNIGGVILEGESKPMALGRAGTPQAPEKIGTNSESYNDGVHPLPNTADDKISTFSIDVDTASSTTEKGVTNSEAYKDYGVNPLTNTADDKFSTFSIDVDTASYTISRKKLMAGILPPPASVRVEEFVNYFKYDYPAPEEGAFSVHLEGAPSPFSGKGGDYIVRVGVQGKRLKTHERKPVHLTFLVDVSGSMGSADKLPMAQRALHILVSNLKKGDTIALSTYAGHTAEILAPTGIENKEKISNAIDQLRSGGGTGMSSGMESAYTSAMKNFQAKHVNRVIILSDGDANIGPKSHQEILSRIKHFADEGVTLSTIGLGMGNYKDTMMEQLANKGNGNYYYIDSAREAKKIFGEQLNGTLQVIAKDVKIQVEFDPKKVSSYRLIGYENREIADEDFRNDRVDAGEIGAGHSVTALYALKLRKGAKGKLATVRIRAKKPDGNKASELAFDLLRSSIRENLSDASKDFQFQMGVVEFAEVLRKSPYAEGLTLALIQEVITPALVGKEDRVEFASLLKKAMSLQ